jgi:hypothetical protein
MIVSHFLHSFVGHPLMAMLHVLGLYSFGDFVHDRLFVEPAPTPTT